MAREKRRSSSSSRRYSPEVIVQGGCAMSIPRGLPDRAVCVIGLGYVGLTLAVAMADSGFSVLGVEIRQEVLDKLAKMEPHFFEPRLKQKLARVLKNGALRVGPTIDEAS